MHLPPSFPSPTSHHSPLGSLLSTLLSSLLTARSLVLRLMASNLICAQSGSMTGADMVRIVLAKNRSCRCLTHSSTFSSGTMNVTFTFEAPQESISMTTPSFWKTLQAVAMISFALSVLPMSVRMALFCSTVTWAILSSSCCILSILSADVPFSIVIDMLTSLVAITSTHIPTESMMSKTLARKPLAPSIRVELMSMTVTPFL
mmetsp:Transcript_5784/g.13844  ORF Transcript_5784/g.13844 Transcript_5784/m.13844 type:complete len:203 (+) Transcript_5784:885-1493(+)